MINTAILVIVKENNTASMTMDEVTEVPIAPVTYSRQYPIEEISVKVQWQQQDEHYQ